MASRGITPDVAETFCLGYVPIGDEFGGRISIPYMTPNGVVDIKYRRIGDSDVPKFFKESGLGTNLYNAKTLIGAVDTVLLVEGELDAIVCETYLNIPTVAYPGVDTWKEKASIWALCFEAVSEVLVISDGDKVGRDSARRIADQIGKVSRVPTRVVDLGDGHDSNSFFLAHGAQALTERLMA